MNDTGHKLYPKEIELGPKGVWRIEKTIGNYDAISIAPASLSICKLDEVMSLPSNEPSNEICNPKDYNEYTHKKTTIYRFIITDELVRKWFNS